VAPPRAIGLSHIAFRLDDEAHLRAAYDDLKARIPHAAALVLRAMIE